MESLMDENGIRWVRDKVELKDLALNYYVQLFTADVPSTIMEFMKGKFPALSKDQSLALSKEASVEEIKGGGDIGCLEAHV